MERFTWVPDHDASEEDTPRVLLAQFGDGYEQRAADGINNITTAWDLQFTLRTRSEVTAMRDFLRARMGVEAFLWAPPGETDKTFKCDKWRRVLRTDTDSSFTATFKRVYE